MHTSLTELDDSYWQFNGAELEKNHKAFLDRHRGQGEYVVAGLTLACPPNVYHPTEFGSTRFALRGLFSQLPKWGKRVLEVGTGSGAIGLCLAAEGKDVTMLDIDPVAVACAMDNATRNRLKVDVRQSDIFSAVPGERYDLVIFNIPLLDKAIEDPLEIIACDLHGELLLRFMREAVEHLNPGGYVCISVGNIGNRAAILKGLSAYNHSIVHSEFYAGVNEWRWLVAAQPLA